MDQPKECKIQASPLLYQKLLARFMKIKPMLAAVAAVCLLTSCEDLFEDGSLQPDGSLPSLTINNPTKNQTITSVQGLPVYITVVDKDKVENINFSVLSPGAESPVVDFNVMPHKTVVEFDTLMALEGVAPGTYTLKITAQDKRTNLSVKQTSFTVK